MHQNRRTFLLATAGALSTATLGPVVAAAQGTPSLDDLAWLSLQEGGDLVRLRKVSPVDLTRACLTRIERLNPRLNAFITVTASQALAEARAAEAEIMKGAWRGPLHGMPIALKDLIDTAGVRTTAASAIFADRIPKEDAEVVRRLKGAGVVMLGKLNMHEFAYGDSSAQSHFGPVRNPWDPERVAGAEQLTSLGKQLNLPVVALAEAGERWATRIEVVHAGGEARQVGARQVDLDRVQGSGRGVVAEVDHVRAREGHDVVHPGSANEEAGERGKIRPRPEIANDGRIDRLEGGDTE